MLINEQLKEVWNKQEKQSRLQREARNRLMKEVIETQRLQIQQKREKTNEIGTDTFESAKEKKMFLLSCRVDVAFVFPSISKFSF